MGASHRNKSSRQIQQRHNSNHPHSGPIPPRRLRQRKRILSDLLRVHLLSQRESIRQQLRRAFDLSQKKVRVVHVRFGHISVVLYCYCSGLVAFGGHRIGDSKRVTIA